LFFYIAKKIILEKNYVIKLYKVIKIKKCGEINIHRTPIILWITIVIHSVLLFSFPFSFSFVFEFLL